MTKHYWYGRALTVLIPVGLLFSAYAPSSTQAQ